MCNKWWMIPIILILTILFFPFTKASFDIIRTPNAVEIKMANYSIRINKNPLQITTEREGRIILESCFSPLLLDTNAPQLKAIGIRAASNSLILQLETIHGQRMSYKISLHRDSYEVSLKFDKQHGRTSFLKVCYLIHSSGYWYGIGEAAHNQPWPLNTGVKIQDSIPADSYRIREPFLFSSEGVGFYIQTKPLTEISINNRGDNRLMIGVMGHLLKYRVFIREKPSQVYESFIKIVGKPRRIYAPRRYFEVPVWSTWAQLYRPYSQEDVLRYVRNIIRYNLPGHTIILDGGWESSPGSYDFDPHRFPNPRKMIDEIHQSGFKVALWVSLWVMEDTETFQYASKRGYFLRDKNDPSKPYIDIWWRGESALVDLGNPKARKWFYNMLKEFTKKYRTDGWKFDTRFFALGAKLSGNLTISDYLKIAAGFVGKFDLAGIGVRIPIQGQKYGFIVRQMDKPSYGDALHIAIKQVLALSSIGYPFVTTDMIGGSLGDPPPSKEMLIRWVEVAAFMPIMYASTGPWGVDFWKSPKRMEYDQETINQYCFYINAHHKISWYIYSLAKEAIKTGFPIVRPLFFHYPTGKSYTVDDEYLLGEDMLVAPVVQEGIRFRTIYLPKGNWIDYWSGEKYQGPLTLEGYPVPLNKIPVFVRSNLWKVVDGTK